MFMLPVMVVGRHVKEDLDGFVHPWLQLAEEVMVSSRGTLDSLIKKIVLEFQTADMNVRSSQSYHAIKTNNAHITPDKAAIGVSVFLLNEPQLCSRGDGGRSDAARTGT